MADLKIRVFKNAEPETTVTIPGGILKVARKLIPKQAVAALQDKPFSTRSFFVGNLLYQ